MKGISSDVNKRGVWLSVSDHVAYANSHRRTDRRCYYLWWVSALSVRLYLNNLQSFNNVLLIF